MSDPTVELSVKDELDWKIERSNEIAAICWEKCEDCNGRGWHAQHWEGDLICAPEYILRLTCKDCDGKGQIQLHDPWRVEALYDAADDARVAMGVWCYTRISKALVLAVNGAVGLAGDYAIVKSQTVEHKKYIIARSCDCLDAHHRAPKISGTPACKHQIAVWLVKAAKKKMYDQEPKHYGPWTDALDGLISGQEADRREAGR